MITLTLPYPPSINRYWRSWKGRVLISREGRAYRDAALAAIYAAPGRHNVSSTDRLRVRIRANPPDNRRRDLDNTLKAVLDAITHAGVWGDDSQIDDLGVTRGTVGAPGSVQVEVERL